MGIGHLVRCLTLADAFTERGLVCHFLCKDHPGMAKNLIERKGHIFYILKLDDSFEGGSKYENWIGSSQKKDASLCLRYMNNQSVSILVVDHYGLDQYWESRLAPYVGYIIAIDDLVNRAHYCDVLVDATYGRIGEDYNNLCGEKTKLLMGSEYCFLRAGFSQLREQAKNKRERTTCITRILINFGGTDPQGYGVTTLNILINNNIKVDIDIVVGSSCLSLSELENISNNNKNIALHVDTEEVALIMYQSDFTIGSLGGSSWERCCLGLPSLTVMAAGNQQCIAEVLAVSGATKRIEFDVMAESINSIFENSNDFSWWHEMSKKSFSICDGEGISNIISEIEGMFLWI